MKIDIGIPEENRNKIAEGLSVLLADTYTLYQKTHGYHWNVTGPQFNTLHTMFMTQYTELWNSIDLIAERIRALGFFAPAGYSAFSKITTIEDDINVPKSDDMIRNDQATLDLLTQRINVHEKTAWMLRSLLE